MLKNLKKLLELEKNEESIFEIIIYGSITRLDSKPNDIDIAVIFLKGNLRERLDKMQVLKSKLRKFDFNIDIKQMLLSDLFGEEFLARTGIILEGYAVFRKKAFSETLGLKAYAVFTYNLKNLSHTQKVRFNFILSGRNSEGMLKRMSAIKLASGAFKVPVCNSLIAEQILKNNNVSYSKKNILEQI